MVTLETLEQQRNKTNEPRRQVWVITNKGFFISAYSSREKAYEARVRLIERGITTSTCRVQAWTLDSVVN